MKKILTTILFIAVLLTNPVFLVGKLDGADTNLIQVPIDSSGNTVPPTRNEFGVDYAVIGVMSVVSPNSRPQATRPSSVLVNLADLGLRYVETVYLATHLSHTFDLPDNVKVATFVCEYVEGGSPTTLDLIWGQYGRMGLYESVHMGASRRAAA